VIHTVGKSSPFRTISVHSHAKSLARSPDMNKFNAAVRRKRSHCQCCRVSDLLSMTPYLAALDRRRHHRRRPDQAKPTSASAPIARAPSSAPESANNKFAKKKCRRRPAAAAPPSRPVQVGLHQSSLESAPASRAREGSEQG
jgi:hypothetical protein